jgi:hypothetical protein
MRRYLVTRAELRAMLRRQLQEDTASQWTDATLNGYLNLGLQFMETSVLQHDMEAFIQVDRTDVLVADEGLVPKPVGHIRTIDVKIKYANDSAYTFATFRRNDQIEDLVEASTSSTVESEPYWSTYGQWIRYWPLPTATSTDGLELIYVPTLTMGADSDVPLLNTHLHEGIVYRAKAIALGDTDEESDPTVLEALDKRLSVVISRIPLYYATDGPPPQFDLGVDHEDGWDA